MTPYKTIGQRAKERFQKQTGMLCNCEKRITKRNIRYYINQFGECTPICSECAKVLAPHIEVI